MIELVRILTPIGLLDSTSMVPIAIVFLVVMLAGDKPILTSFALILGIFVVYLVCGLLIMLGLQSAFDEINDYAIRLWKDPYTEEIIVQILLGIALIVFGVRITDNRKQRAEKPVATGMTPIQAAVAGAGLTIVGMPGAVPYFAAIDFILRAELTMTQQLVMLGYYNLVFIVPLASIIVLRLVLGERSTPILQAIKGFFDRWGKRVIVTLLLVLGAALVIEGVTWFFGFSLLGL